MKKIILMLVLVLPNFVLSQPIEGDKSITLSGNGILLPDSLRMFDVKITPGYFFRDNIEINLGLRFSSSAHSLCLSPGVNYGLFSSDQLVIMAGLSLLYDVNKTIWSTGFNLHLIYLLSEMAGLKLTNTYEITPGTNEKMDKVWMGAILYF